MPKMGGVMSQYYCECLVKYQFLKLLIRIDVFAKIKLGNHILSHRQNVKAAVKESAKVSAPGKRFPKKWMKEFT